MDILSIGVGVDTKDLVRGVRELEKFGKSANKASEQTDVATKSMAGMGKSVNALVAAVGSATLVRVLLQATEQFTKLNAQLKISARTQEDYTKSFQDVIRISNLAQSSLEGTATLYARLSNTLKDTNVTQQQFANITESVALGLRVSGATTAEAQSAMLQLSQAFAAGVLRGEEFNAVSEASFPLMKALADSMGIPIEQLRSMAMEGKITRDELVKAFGDPALIARFQNQAKELNTVGGAFQVLKNNITIAIGEFDQATGASAALAKAIVLLGQNFDVLLVVLAPVGIALAALAAPAILTGLAALVAVFAGPIGIIALLTAAGGAVLKFGIESETAYSKALKGAQKFNDEQRKTVDVTKTTVSAGVKQFEKLGKAKDEASTRATELQKRISSLLNRADMKGRVSELRAELEDVQLALKNINAESDKLFVTLSKQGDVLGAKVPFMRAISPKFTGAPNFTANLEARNVDEINAKLEERAKLEKERIQDIKDADKKQFERAQARFNQAKEFNDMETKFFNLLEKSADDRDKKSLSFKNQMHEMDKKFLDVLSRTKSKIIDESQKKQLDALKELKQEQKRISDSMSRSLTDALLRGFENGLGFAENFKRTLRNMFATLVLQPIINFALQPVTAAVGGAMAGLLGTGTANASTMSIGSTLGGLGNLFTQTGDSIVAGVASVGKMISGDLGGISGSIGRFIQGNAEFIAGSLSFLDAGIKLLSGDTRGAAFSGAGAGIGLAITGGNPLGGAFGSFVGNILGGLGGKKQPPRTSTDLPDVAEAFNQQLSALLQGFGGAGNVTSTASFTGRAGGSGYGGFSGMVEDMAISDSIRYKDAFNDASLQAFITRTLTETLTRAIKSTDIDQAFKDLFDGITDREKMGKTIQAVIQLNQNNQQLTNTLGITATQVALLANESDIAGDNLVTLVNTLTGISTELLTTGDALVAIKAGIDGAFLTLSNTQVPANLKAFDEAIKAIDKTTAEGRQDFLGLVAIRQTFAEFETAIAGLRGSVRGALFSIVDDGERLTMMQADLAKMFADVNLEVPETVEKFKELISTVDFTTAAGINLASVMPALANAFNQTQDAAEQARVALENQVESARIALETTARAQRQLIADSANEANRLAQETLQNSERNVESARANLMSSFDAERNRLQGIIDSVGSLRENLATAFNAERSRLQGVIDSVATLKENLVTVFAAEKDRLKLIIDNVDTFKSALRQAFDAKASGLQDTISKFKDFGKTIRDFRKGLLQTSPVVSDPLGFNRAKFLETASLAKAGDTAAMDELTLVASDFLESSENYSKDFNQFQSDFLEVNRILADVENSTFASASVAELQLDLLKQQVSSLINLDENILSVDDAIANLNKAQTEANVAQAQIKHLNELQTRLLGENNESLVSVQDAVDNLVDAQTQAHEAQNEIKRLNELQTHFLGASNESLMSVDAQLQNLLNAQTLALQAQTNLNSLNNQQINLLGVINESVLSVATAIAGFNVARQAQSTAQTAATSAQGQLAQVQQSQSNADTVLTPESIYEQFLGRKPDPEGLAYWKSQFGATVDTSELRIFQEAVRANQALGLEQTDEALVFAQQKFANGASFTNGIVSRPTTFNTGMMGESGSEAIMPLSNVGGRLGVTSNNSEMVAQLKAISEKMTRLEAVQVATAQNTGKVAKIIERADNGESINVTVTA